MELKDLLRKYKEAVKKRTGVKTFASSTIARLIGVEYENLKKWEKGVIPKKESDRNAIKTYFQIDSLEDIPENTVSLLPDIKLNVSKDSDSFDSEPQVKTQAGLLSKAKEFFSGLRDILREDGDFTALNKEEEEAREALSKAENEFFRALIKKMEDNKKNNS